MKLTILKRWSSLLLLLLSFGITETKAQPTLTVLEEWTTQEGTQNLFYQSATATDGSGNVYKTGATINSSGNYDMITAKYDKFGVQQWIVQYAGAGAGDDAGARLKVDGAGNVFVVGSYYANSTDSSNSILIKYNSSGTQQWTATYDGGQGRGDAGTNLEMDAATGDIYVCGTTYTDATDEYDFLTLKYNSSGVQQWVRKWDNVNLWDGAHKISFRNGTVTVSGGTQVNTTKYDYATIQYSSAGVLGSSNLAGGSNPVGFNKITGMVTDASNNIYITGSVMNANYDCYTMKLDANLNQLWTATYNGSANLNDVANDIQVDASGNVYIAGFTTTSAQGRDWVTVKYNSSGTQVWTATHNSAHSGNDEANSLQLDNSNNVIVGGAVFNGGNNDYHTIKYSNSGSKLWEIGYNGMYNGNDRILDMALDNNGNVIVSGQTELHPAGTFAYTTIKYIERTVIIPPDTIPLANSYTYTENRGQLRKSDGTDASIIRFYNVSKSPAMFFSDATVSYQFIKMDTVATTQDSTHRVDMTFVNANTTKVYPMDARSSFYNFFLAHIPEGRTRVPSNSRLLYADVWNDIDLLMSSDLSGMKYYLIIEPGASPSDITFRYSGQTSISAGTGDLVISTSIGSLTQPKGKAYEIDDTGARVDLNWEPGYSVTGTNVSFTTGSYDNSNTLVLEINWGPVPAPVSHIGSNIEWSVYFGGAGNEEGTYVTTDADGYSYYVGFTQSNLWYQPVPGAFDQPANNSTFDAYIAQFGQANPPYPNMDADEERWFTFWGGSGNDKATGVKTIGGNTANGKCYVVGSTQSQDMPTFANTGAYNDLTHNGGTDAFIVRIDNATGGAGLLNNVWATYYGGQGDDYATCVTAYGTGGIVVGGVAGSSPSSQVTCSVPTDSTFTICSGGAYFDSTYGGNKDAFIAHFSLGEYLISSTYFGGDQEDILNALEYDSNGNLWAVGRTASDSTFPNVTLTGAYNQSTFGGGAFDAYIAKFDSLFVQDWTSFFGGNGRDEIFTITSNAGNEIFIGGTTASLTPSDTSCYCVPPTNSGGFPLCYLSGAYFQTTSTTNPPLGSFGGGGTDGFFAKFNNNAVMKWGTYYGGNGKDAIYGMDAAPDDRLHWVGETFSTSGLPLQDHVFGHFHYSQAYPHGGNNGSIGGMFDPFQANEWMTYTSYWNGLGSAGDALKCMHFNNGLMYVTGYTDTPWPDFYTMSFSQPTYCCPSAYYDNTLEGYRDAALGRWSMNDMFMLSTGETAGTNNIMTIYPNPSNGLVYFKFTLAEMQNVQLEVYAINGQKVYEQKLGEQKGIVQGAFDFSAFSNGLYFIRATVGNQVLSSKLIKQ